MVSLGEHVDGSDPVEPVSHFRQQSTVSSKAGRITGDVDESARRRRSQRVNPVNPEPASRRVGDYHVPVLVDALDDIFRRAADDPIILDPGPAQIGLEVAGCGRVGFDANDATTAAAKGCRKKTSSVKPMRFQAFT